MNYVLGIDFGGGASKATLLDENGRVACTNIVEYPTYYPKPGWAEQDPEDWYAAIKENIAAVLKKSGVRSAKICAVSLDAATHTAVLMDERFHILCPSIYWTDTRCQKEVLQLSEKLGTEIEEKTLHKIDTIWTLPQLLWVKNNRPEIFSRIGKIMFAKDFVRHRLTGDYVTDVIEAQGSMLFDFGQNTWSDSLCAAIGVDKHILPKIVSPFDIAGTVTKSAAEDTGLKEGTKVLCGTMDTVMEVFSAGAVRPGQMTVKLATAGRICVITNEPRPGKHFVNYSHIIDGLWYPGTATKSCAASYRWYRDTFGESYKELDESAAKTPIGAEGLMFHPYLNGELTPYADPQLCGSFTGIRSGHTKGHFSRAVLEGVALSLLDCKKTVDEANISYENTAAVIGGGANSPLWRQIVSDVLGIRLIQKKYSDSSFGSAMLAGVAVGFFENPAAALEKCNETLSETVPNFENHKTYGDMFCRYKAVHDALSPIYHKYGGL